jgi:hypothetical protein
MTGLTATTTERAKSSWGSSRIVFVVALVAVFSLWQWRNASAVDDVKTSFRAALSGASAGSTADWSKTPAPGALTSTIAELSKPLTGGDIRIAALHESLLQAATRLDAIIAVVEPALAGTQGVEASALRYSLRTSSELLVGVLSGAAALLLQQSSAASAGAGAASAGAGAAASASAGNGGFSGGGSTGHASRASGNVSAEATSAGGGSIGRTSFVPSIEPQAAPPREANPYVSGIEPQAPPPGTSSGTPSTGAAAGTQQQQHTPQQPGRTARDLWHGAPPGPTFTCGAEARERQAARFAAEMALRAGAGNPCPPQDWIAALRDADFERGTGPQRVAINAGANKGWLATTLIHHWSPHRGASAEMVLSSLERVVSPAMAPCGACDDCRARDVPPATAPWKQAGAAPVPAMEVFALEPAPANAALLRGLLQHAPRLGGLLHVHALGLANYSGAGQMQDVRPGDWRGVVQRGPAPPLPPPPPPEREFLMLSPTAGAPRPLVNVSVTTLDGFVRSVVDPELRYVLDILYADAAGGNGGVLAGARNTLPFTRLLVFGHGRDGLPAEERLSDTVQVLDALGLDCYFAWGMGRLTLLRLTGCWDERFGVWEWGTVMCLNRRDYEWRPLLAELATWLHAPPPAMGAAGEGDDDDNR